MATLRVLGILALMGSPNVLWAQAPPAPLAPPAPPAPQVFISYAHADTRLAWPVYHHLARISRSCPIRFRTWFDRIHLLPGYNIDQTIQSALDASSIVLVLIGTPCTTCIGEWVYALDERKLVVPAKLWPAAYVPWRLRPLAALSSADLAGLEPICKLLTAPGSRPGSHPGSRPNPRPRSLFPLSTFPAILLTWRPSSPSPFQLHP